MGGAGGYSGVEMRFVAIRAELAEVDYEFNGIIAHLEIITVPFLKRAAIPRRFVLGVH